MAVYQYWATIITSTSNYGCCETHQCWAITILPLTVRTLPASKKTYPGAHPEGGAGARIQKGAQGAHAQPFLCQILQKVSQIGLNLSKKLV